MTSAVVGDSDSTFLSPFPPLEKEDEVSPTRGRGAVALSEAQVDFPPSCSLAGAHLRKGHHFPQRSGSGKTPGAIPDRFLSLNPNQCAWRILFLKHTQGVPSGLSPFPALVQDTRHFHCRLRWRLLCPALLLSAARVSPSSHLPLFSMIWFHVCLRVKPSSGFQYTKNTYRPHLPDLAAYFSSPSPPPLPHPVPGTGSLCSGLTLL